ncbi:MAG: WhiB family transcriptional regulator [Intrasporangium sp.]|uniref:WhiB family transcriptional regulator n=1 Tax=Intrasporangium sp. TaxID=1925024 RepID=UPI0026476ECD|nr:WhiB family transcriptional regulator [Intrasporangium sp.]MDN5798164.1 WhiB family transcriptional regulator [Intrasporangium sp.]
MISYPRFDGTQACLDAPALSARAFAGTFGADPAPAKRICAGCSFLRACREYALATEVYGVWGGTTDADRDQLRAHSASPAPVSISSELDTPVLALHTAEEDVTECRRDVAAS